MAINETILKNRKYRHCIDNTPGNKKWNRYSFWTHASDVEFNDGKNLQDKLGTFKGVTTNENQTAGYAADVTLVKSIKNSLAQLITSLTNLVNGINNRLGGLRFYEDSNGKWVVGADSVPKKLGSGGLEGVKKIVYQEIQNNDTAAYPRFTKTISPDGNIITYTINKLAPNNTGISNPYKNEFDTEYDLAKGSVQDWAGGWVNHYICAPVFFLNKLFPNDYQNWTKDNFLYFFTDWNPRCQHGSSNNLSIVEDKQQCNLLDRTYDPSTGKLRFNRAWAYAHEDESGDNETGGDIRIAIRGWELWIIE